MKRPIFIGAVFALTGAVSAICSNLLLLWIAGGIESLLLIYLCRKRKLSAIFYCYVIVCLLAMITSYARTSENITKSFYENQLEESNGKQVNIKGNVKKITQQNGYMQLMLQNCQIHIIDENIDLKQAGVLVTVSSFSGINGDTVELNGKLKCFERSRNPGEFDSRVYYHSLGLDYRCQAYNLEIVKHADYGLERIAQIVRTHMNTVFNVVAPEDAGILESVILGNRENLDQSTKEMYQISGIAHLLAISGVKTLCLVSPLSLESGLKWGFLRLHNAKKYIRNLCFKGQFLARCPSRFCGGKFQYNNLAKGYTFLRNYEQLSESK